MVNSYEKKRNFIYRIFHFFNSHYDYGYALILPNEVLIAADLKVNFDALGILIGLYTIILGVSILVFGYLTDKINRKRILIFSGLLWAIPVIFYLFILEFWQLLLLRIIAAIAQE